MARTPQDITETELDILQVLWERGPQTIRRITDELYPGGKVAQYATVQKLLERLQAKDCVRRARADGVNVFEATLAREELVGRRLRAVAEQLCGGSWTPLLTHLVQAERLSSDDRRTLRQLVDDLSEVRPSTGRPSAGRRRKEPS